jgi:DNA-binding response OmpR family regulator
MTKSHVPTRVAIVEDDADQRHTIEEYLADAGYAVWSADSAEGFYRRFLVEPADVVILDVGLPGEDGLSVASLLRSRPEVTVVILSARDALQDRLAGLRAGADRYLIKPVNLLELAANIDAAASRLASGPVEGEAAAPQQEAHVPTTPWSLALRDWVLTSPQGRTLHLTTHEFLFLQQLIHEQGRPVLKRQLIDELFGKRATNGADRLNLLVARLRKKATEALVEPLPVKTLHQIGYAFTARATVTQS